jgi:hypothetical protein
MDIIGSLFAGGIKGVAEGIGSMAKGIREAIVGPELTPEQKTQIQLQLLAMEQAANQAAAQYESQLAAGQINLNTLDAQSTDRFRSYGRPAAIWMCVLGLFYSFLLQPLLPWTVETFCVVFGYTPLIKPLPNLPTEILMTLGGSLLGLGGYRSWEKTKGRA